MFTLAELWGLRPDATNPCRHVEPYREQRIERFLSDGELVSLGTALAQAEAAGAESDFVVAAVRLLILKLLGHTQPSTTQRYAHLADDPLRQATDRIGCRIAAAMEGKPDAEVIPLRRQGRVSLRVNTAPAAWVDRILGVVPLGPGHLGCGCGISRIAQGLSELPHLR